MASRLLLPAVSLLLLAGAILSGEAVSGKIRVDTFQHVQAVESGFQRLKHFVASALYLQLDDYHHIEMYQGIPWTQVTDYLPQMWLIARLDPHFTDVYTDAAYHLAVNLGHVEDGISFIKEGLEKNPDSLDVRYEYTYLLWETGTGTPGEIVQSCLAYNELVRRNPGDLKQPYCEPATATLMAEALEAASDSTNPYSQFYRQRAFLTRTAMRQGIYYTGYLEDPPPWITPAALMEHQ